jgi:hypothetical protein
VAVDRDVCIDVNVIYHDMTAHTRADEGVNVTRYHFGGPATKFAPLLVYLLQNMHGLLFSERLFDTETWRTTTKQKVKL